MEKWKKTRQYTGSEIAIVGMACRFPGAGTVEEFWRNLCEGVESLTWLTDEDLRRSGVDPALLKHPTYVRRVPVLPDIESFDAAFFGYTPLEAKIMDPQHRLFLECAWEALETAGYHPERIPGRVGVFTGAKTNTYLLNLFANGEIFRSLDPFQIALGNDLAAMATRVSYKFNLTGPSYALHTACSTSLVAVHLACQSLLLGESWMALAGGAAINVPQRRGYLYQKGGILSADGSCRTFDAKADGSNFGNGVGVVVLKRLEDALKDGDSIYALILGSAANNDGAKKASFTAPGVEGQTEVLLEAMACAGIDADTLSYVEAHGTATELGDSIEILALRNAFHASTRRKSFCAIGSVKTNLGHLETAAGVAGLIKTALALQHRKIPPSLHFEAPNPKLHLEESPFYVNTNLANWEEGETPRRAGVSSFGIGSTNAHVILEEAPPVEKPAPSRPWQLLVLSARTPTALETMTSRLAQHLARSGADGLAFPDVAYTLQVGRKGFPCRRAVICQEMEDALQALETLNSSRVFTHEAELRDHPVTFLFPGLGDQHLEMGFELYRTEATFRQHLDRCADLLRPHLGLDLREVLYPRGTAGEEDAASSPRKPDLRRMVGRRGDEGKTGEELHQTALAQPALFAVEYALAQLWMEWGIRPQALMGYSLGEYVAAALAGVFSLEEALALVAQRARLIQELPPGAMLAVPWGEEEIASLLEKHRLSLAAVNGPGMVVAAGPVEGVEALEEELAAREVVCRRLETTHAFHSWMMDSVAPQLTELVRQVQLRPPEIPYISNLTGTWIRPEEAPDPAYWARHMCQPVRFAQGMGILLRERAGIFLEVGPGQSLTSWVKQHEGFAAGRASFVFSSLPSLYDGQGELESVFTTLGRLWLVGKEVDWRGFYARERRRRVPLPTYPFERQRYWVDTDLSQLATGRPQVTQVPQVTLEKQPDVADWFYRPVWREAPRPQSLDQPHPEDGGWLVFDEGQGLGEALLTALTQRGERAIRVVAGEGFSRAGEGEYVIDPRKPEDYVALLQEVWRQPGGFLRVVHLWSVSTEPSEGDKDKSPEAFQQVQDLGFYSLLFLAQGLGRLEISRPVQIDVVATGLHRIAEGDRVSPAKATLLGPARVIPQEFPRVTSRCVGVSLSSSEGRNREKELAGLAQDLLAEFLSEPREPVVAYRRGQRWVQDFEPVPLEARAEPSRLRPRGVYLLTGGLGGLGLVLAEDLARTVQARLVLVARTPLPPREEWSRWLEIHGQDDEGTAEKIRTLLRLEELGAEVMTAAADAADEGQMRTVVEEARARFGAIHGVLHLAGIPGGGIIQLKSPAMVERIFGPKVEGTRVLQRIFQEEELDFLVLFSSIASILGEFGQVDYCAANAYLDAVAIRNAARGGPPTLTINWDIWQEVGLAVHTEVPPHLRKWRQEMLEKAILPREGVEAFHRILGSDLPQVVVSAQELHGRIKLGKSFTGERFLEELGRSRSAAESGGSRRVVGTEYVAAGEGLERRLAEIWARVLGVEKVGVNDNFFDLGGNSLLGLQLVNELGRELGLELAPVTLFEFPTVRGFARHLEPQPQERGGIRVQASRPAESDRDGRSQGIAIIAMAGRFPGAPGVEALWENLRQGVESVTFFTDEELLAAGVDPDLFQDPQYVKAGAILEEVDLFDAGLFAYSPREAEVMDPQHRVFLECAWEVLERAGYDPETYPGSIGVFAGSNLSTYLLRLYADPDVRTSVNLLQAILGNDKDSLTTTVSYKLNLRGPSVAVQTFCSTSLVAVHMACQSLLNGECDMALAGGVRIVVPERQGYLYEPGGISPSDGHTRPFDAKANGSILGNGVGIVCLKRLEDALANGDLLLAVIKGSAINNDGSLKAGYTAPSVAGQAEVIRAALEEAGVDPETVTYVEAHGSATELGDPIEVLALTKAYGSRTEKRGFCAIGSVKSNFGHLDRAAGVTGLIKTVLALQHGAIPPSINFQEPNPKIDFANSPFYVNTTLSPWEKGEGRPRRAGVNSLGMGGTNVHVIVEEVPEAEPSGPSRPWQLLVLSAKTEAALDAVTGNLTEHLRRHPDLNLADAAFTLKVGRRALDYRRILVCHHVEDTLAALAGQEPGRIFTGFREEGERSVVFLFPGLGGQYVQMARGLYETEPTFRREVDRCAEILMEHLGFDLRGKLYPQETDSQERDSQERWAGHSKPPVNLRQMLRRAEGGSNSGDGDLHQTLIAHPLLFVIEYALSQLWMEWGIRPRAMIGYSLGEYIAACLAGVFSLEDALKLVAERARRIQELPPGTVLAVALPEKEAQTLLGTELSLMAVNGPEQSVISGPVAAVAALEEELLAQGVACRRLAATHAFHSRMMEPLFDQVVELVQGMELRPPRIPYLSNLTGTWITSEEATDPTYWARHMCQPVRFAEAVVELLQEPGRVLLEMGPPVLSSLILQHPAAKGDEGPLPVLAALRHGYETLPDVAHALQTLGKLWLLGVEVDWTGFYAHERRRRVLLPTYPFQRQRYWIEARQDLDRGTGRRLVGDVSRGGPWLYVPSWQRTLPARPPDSVEPQGLHGRWWLLMDEWSLGKELAKLLEEGGGEVVRVRAGDRFERRGAGEFTLRPAAEEDYVALLREVGEAPEAVVHLWGWGPEDGMGEGLDPLHPAWERGLGSLLRLGEILGGEDRTGALPLWVVTRGAHEVTGEEDLRPEWATILAPYSLLRRESKLEVKVLDTVLPAKAPARLKARLAREILGEMLDPAAPGVAALRGGHRWVPTVTLLGQESGNGHRLRFKEHGVYLWLGGIGDLGYGFGEYLARTHGAAFALVETPGFPAREEWDEWLAHDGGEGEISQKIQRIRALEAAGAITLVLTADLEREGQGAWVVEQVESRLGPLDGILWAFEPDPFAAGSSGELEGRLQEVVQGLVSLDRVLAERDLDLRLLLAPGFQSGPGGSTEAVALGLFLDSLACWSRRNRDQPWTSVTWGMGADPGADGVAEAVRRVLQTPGVSQIIVSSRPLAEDWSKVEGLAESSQAATAPMTHYPRPSLRVEYVAPRNPTEEAIAAIWRELLGVDQIGVHDRFLELGGDSLLATRLISRMRDLFHLDLPIRLFFEASTVAELAKAVEEMRAQEEEQEIAELVSLLDQLSEEEVEQELARRRQSLPSGAVMQKGSGEPAMGT